MSNEEILSEIGKAMSMMGDTKSIVNEALCHAQNIVKKYNEQTVSEDTLEMERMKALNDGRNEVWELTKKLWYLGTHKCKEIFGYEFSIDIIEHFTPQEALAKLEAYEKEQNYIYVGDVVNIKSIAGSNYIGVVTQITDNQNAVCVVYSDGSTEMTTRNNMTKTGKHIDLTDVFKQINGGKDYDK